MVLVQEPETLGLQQLYREGVDLCGPPDGLLPALAACRLMERYTLSNEQLLELARIGLGDRIGALLGTDRRGIGPSVIEGTRGGGSVNPPRTAQWGDVLTKLYEGAGGVMKPLLRFTIEDCQLLEALSASRAKGYEKVAKAARISRELLAREGREQIGHLSSESLAELRRLWS
jgi:hypothetical protein